jgi:hypothetical protein
MSAKLAGWKDRLMSKAGRIQLQFNHIYSSNLFLHNLSAIQAGKQENDENKKELFFRGKPRETAIRLIGKLCQNH